MGSDGVAIRTLGSFWRRTTQGGRFDAASVHLRTVQNVIH